MTAVDDLDRKPARGVRLATSRRDDAFTALGRNQTAARHGEAELHLSVRADRLQPEDLAAALRKSLPNTVVFGCTTAGQITAARL
ncbi:hypothetical protein F2981_26090 (plasmid) [Sinorhizobium meliloti]|nr:hypothetical protein [Sinorhizobium meliloti]